jgi:hypothetical protein
MKKRIFNALNLLLLASLLLSACGALASKSDSSESDIFFSEGEGAIAIGLPAEAPSADFADQSISDDSIASEELARVGDAPESTERLVIKNANISIVVDDPAQSMDDITALAEELGGFVVNSNLYQSTTPSGLEVPSAGITIRVPSDSLRDALEAIEAQAVRVASQSQSGQDVTSQYTDLQSRLRNLEDAEDLLREIMASAKDTEDVLNAFNQLNYITEQVEVLKGQIQYFEESAALSAISVTLIASAAEQPITIGGWEPVGVAKDAIQALVNALQGLVNVVIWLALYLLPFGLVIGLPLWYIVRAVRRRVPKAKESGKAKK